jgi:putative endonuclease
MKTAVPIGTAVFLMEFSNYAILDAGDNMNYTYMLRCADGTLYTGWSTDPLRRAAAHNAGKGAKYTRSRLPVELVYQESFPTKQEAMRREWQIKQLSREEKLALIASAKII